MAELVRSGADHSADQRGDHRGTRAIQRLVEFAPSSGGLALWVRHRDLPAADDDDSVTRAPVFTDGQTIVYRPSFEALPLPQQTGWVAHEVLHIALRHPQRFLRLQQRLGDVDLRLFNTCADAIVNSALSHLGWLELAPADVQLPALLTATLALQQDTDTALLAWDLERLYAAIDDRRPPDDASTRRRDGPRAARVRVLGGTGASDLLPAPGAASAPEDDAEQTREWTERLLRAHAGDGVHSLLRALLADVPTSRTPWEQLLRVQMARALAHKPALSWSRPSRSYIAHQGRLRGSQGKTHRMPWEPGRSGTQPVPRLVLVVDVSGSIDADLMQRFAREVQALARRLGAGLVLVAGDDHVQQVLHHRPGRTSLPDMLQGLRFEGGGTDFRPLLAEAAQHRPDLVVVLTDLDGPAGESLGFPVLWAVPEAQAHAVAPFGRVLVLA
jgi:predicted metal-dependent peptidase